MTTGSGSVGLTLRIGGTVVGVVTLLITIYVVFHQPLACAITTEKDCRVKDVGEIRERMYQVDLKQAERYAALDKKVDLVLAQLKDSR